jgi:PhnB protein
MPMINTYLNFKDTCEVAFDFYRSVIGGEFTTKMRMGDVDCGQPVSESAKDLIMHVSLPIGNGTVLMGSDCPEGFGPQLTVGNNFAVSLSTDSKEQADEFFKGLSEGGNVVMPMADQFWGAYFGMINDKFGINWMVSYDNNRPQ